MIIEARLVDDLGETARVRLALIERESTTSTLGLTLAEGRELLASAQKYIVAEQSLSIAGAHSYCSRRGVRLGVKGWHQRRSARSSVWLMFEVHACAAARAQQGDLGHLSVQWSKCWQRESRPNWNTSKSSGPRTCPMRRPWPC